MTEPLRIGIVGTGGWGTHVATQFHEHPDATIAALADPTAAHLAEAGETFEVGSDARYDAHEAMLDAEADLDAVQITSPHVFHARQIRDALAADLHVFCEKPLTIGLENAEELAREVEATDRVVMVGYQRHVHPAYREVKAAIERGDVDPALVTAELTQPWLEHVRDTWRANPDLSGGGNLYDSGSHLLDALVWLLGRRPTHVTAEMVFADEERELDAQAALTVRFEGDTVATVAVSGDASDTAERICLRGDGRCVVEGTGWDHRRASVTDADGAELAAVAGDLSSYEKVDAFLESVHTGEAPPATARDAFYATAITEAAYESARTGERVAVADPF